MSSRRRPAPAECAEYYHRYTQRVPDGDIVTILRDQLAGTLALLGGVSEERALHRYAPGKWTLKEVLGHQVDTERIFAYRALRFARGDATPLPGIEQDDLVAGAGFDARTLASLLDEYRHQRSANLALFDSFDEEILDRAGQASGCPFTVRSIPYIMAGHELHHVAVMKERYL